MHLTNDAILHFKNCDDDICSNPTKLGSVNVGLNLTHTLVYSKKMFGLKQKVIKKKESFFLLIEILLKF